MTNLKVGDIIVFKGDGSLYEVLSRALKLFEPSWDRWGWHTAFIATIKDGQIYIAEALAKGVCVNPLSTYSKREYRAYRWLDAEPDRDKVMAFVREHRGDHYDVLCYIWTFVQRLVLKLSRGKVKLGYLKNDDYTCWEWVSFFCESFGKPWCEEINFPLLTDFLNQKPTQVL